MAATDSAQALREEIERRRKVAGLARSTYDYPCQVAQRADRQFAMEVMDRAIYDEHKGR